ncbi:hypothetical protein [Streptomyces sp. NBC_01190]|uniref:hypothetical protein n=1 Tax=Streptomyces sp. NBC_01190 TaxID=2903767 RepID=UPI00386BFCF3|nr:hypothetical protein OG519_09255 [Streptomyces sp. NBC_01190]
MTTTALDARGLLTPPEFDAVAQTVRTNNLSMDIFTAERIVTEALAFVAIAAANPATVIAPARVVEEGWHALILHTAVYARLCDRLGRFIHHYPEPPDLTRHDDEVMDRTLSLLQTAGHDPDMDVWAAPSEGRIVVVEAGVHTPKPADCSPIEIIRPPKPEPAPLEKTGLPDGTTDELGPDATDDEQVADDSKGPIERPRGVGHTGYRSGRAARRRADPDDLAGADRRDGGRAAVWPRSAATRCVADQVRPPSGERQCRRVVEPSSRTTAVRVRSSVVHHTPVPSALCGSWRVGRSSGPMLVLYADGIHWDAGGVRCPSHRSISMTRHLPRPCG